MGYCMEQVNCKITITADNQKTAFKPVQKKLLSGLRQKGGENTTYDWVDTDEIKNAKTLIDILKAFRWSPDLEKRKITSLHFDGEKLGDDHVLFEAIAPWVKNGSFIEMQGEDGEMWRWVFKKGVCKEISATISYDD